MKKISFLFLVVFAFVVLSACASAEVEPMTQPEVAATPIPEPYEGKVTIQYEYGTLPEWMDASSFPASQELPISFNAEDGWSKVKISMLPYENIELFSLEADPPNYENDLFGGCYWEWYGSSYDDDTLYSVSYAPDSWRKDCTSLQEAVLPNVEVTMAYCRPFEAGWLCQKQGLTVVIEDESLSFTAKDSFLPQYRVWVKQVANFFGYPELPEVLQPDYNYELIK